MVLKPEQHGAQRKTCKPLDITLDQTQQVGSGCKAINLCLGDAFEKLSDNNDNCLLWFPWDHKCFLPYSKQIIQ